jgi:hypothetical protein
MEGREEPIFWQANIRAIWETTMKKEMGDWLHPQEMTVAGEQVKGTSIRKQSEH